MRPIVDSVECQRDSPYFRHILEENEKNIEVLEYKLEKIIKQCSQMVNTGKTFNMEQEQVVHSMWELSGYFSDDSVVQGSLNCLLDSLKEAANYHKILIDQAARAIIKNFSNFIKEEIKTLKEKRHWFEKASLEMDTVLHKSANISKAQDNEEMNKQVWATRQAFRHTSIDYTHALSMVQAKKRHEVVDAILSYTKAYNTFYHQGSDLCNDLKPSLDKISKDVHEMRDEVADLERSMENRHFDISGKALISVNENRNSCYPITMQGYLFKRTNNAFKSWNRRYFTLQNNQLVYRKRSGEEVTVMEDDLRLCSVKPAVDMERRFCFEITSNVKSHMLQAESEESCQLWIEAMSRAISSAIQNNEYPYTPPPSNNDSPGNKSTSSLSPSPAESPSTNKQSDKSEGSSASSVWKEIMKIPGNNVCCDCGSPDPKWASINLGITLCIECSGIHRSFGVHYSKVRSITLDKWDVEVLRVMEKLGNDIVNQIYLSNKKRAESVFHSNIDGTSNMNITPATPECARPVREAWIKAKYMDKLFVTPISNEIAFAKILNHSKSFGRKQKVKKGKSNPLGNNALEVLSSPTSPMLSDSSSSSSLDPGERLSPSKVPSNPGLSQTDWTKMISENALRMESLTPNHLLLTASSLGHVPLMCLSFALGAHKNFQDHDGRTPLHHSISTRSAIAVEYLLLNGVQVNIEDQSGRTPLHLAAIEANILQVYRLIKYRADWKIKDKDEKTPVDYAVQSSEPDLVTLLRVATLSEQLDKELVEEDMMTIMQDLYRKKNHLLEESEDWSTTRRKLMIFSSIYEPYTYFTNLESSSSKTSIFHLKKQ